MALLSEGTVGLRSWRYADGTASLRAVVATNSSAADGVASALKPRRTRVIPYPTAATVRTSRISEATFQGFIKESSWVILDSSVCGSGYFVFCAVSKDRRSVGGW